MTAGKPSAGLGRMLLRRWPVVGVGLALTAALVASVIAFVPATYQATTHVLLLPPESAVTPGGNPYLNLGGLDPAVAVLGRAMSGDGTLQRIEAAGATGEFTVEPDPLTSAPVALVTAEAKSRDEATRTLDVVLGQIKIELASLQTSTGTATKDWITGSVIEQDETVTVVQTGKIRAAIAALVAGLALTVFCAAGLDAILRRRQARARHPRELEVELEFAPQPTLPKESRYGLGSPSSAETRPTLSTRVE